jgi:hypothetical protein
MHVPLRMGVWCMIYMLAQNKNFKIILLSIAAKKKKKKIKA